MSQYDTDQDSAWGTRGIPPHNLNLHSFLSSVSKERNGGRDSRQLSSVWNQAAQSYPLLLWVGPAFLQRVLRSIGKRKEATGAMDGAMHRPAEGPLSASASEVGVGVGMSGGQSMKGEEWGSF